MPTNLILALDERNHRGTENTEEKKNRILIFSVILCVLRASVVIKNGYQNFSENKKGHPKTAFI